MDFYEATPAIEHPPSYYVKHNMMVTTSGVNDPAPLLCTQLVLGADRIMFAVDYPYQRNEDAVDFIESVTLSDRDRALICHQNAERVLKL